MSRFNSRKIALIGLKGEKGEPGDSGIRVLETAPDLSTVGYVGEIVQVTNGTAYQCFAIGLQGEGSPNGVVSGIYYQIYSDTLNQKMYWQNSSTNHTQWSELKATDYPYVEQAYTWFELSNYQNLIKQQKRIRVQTIAGSGSGAGEEIGLGELDRRIDFRIGGNWGFRMQGLAGANDDNVVFLPIPSTNNGRVERTDLGTEAYPFRKLYLNDGVYVNGVKLGGGTKLYQHVIPFNINGWGGGLFIYSYKGNSFTSQDDFYDGILGFDASTRLVNSNDGTKYFVLKIGIDNNSNLTLIVMKETDYTIQEISLVGIEFEDTVTEL